MSCTGRANICGFNHREMGTVLERSNGVVYIKCTPMQFRTSEIIMLHYSHKENKVNAYKGYVIFYILISKHNNKRIILRDDWNTCCW